MDPVNYQFADPNAAILNGVKLGAGSRSCQQHAAADRPAARAAQQAQQQQRTCARWR
jgi:hypothetical protein